MTQEEKLEEAKRLYETANADQKYVLESLFPELKESEDERIRRQTLKVLNYYKDEEKSEGRMPTEIDECIAWLEKQGEQKPVDFSDLRTWKYIVDAVWTKKEGIGQYLDSPFTEEVAKKLQKRFGDIEQKSTDKIEPKFKVGDTITDPTDSTFTFHINAIKDGKYMESDKDWVLIKEADSDYELVEQKPADNAEPKFHEGDWIVFNGLTLLINEVVQGYYRTISRGGITNSYDWDIDNVARLWTVQDAKDGDVLYLQKDGKEHIIIYKGVLKERFRTFVSAYCAYNGIVDAFCFADVSKYVDIAYEGIMPATKEQYDQLEKAMADAGYTFDFEKKELKKIEQKPAWSEEDEKMIDLLIAIFRVSYPDEVYKANPIDTIDMKSVSSSEIIDWLKSLKDRVLPQPKQEWSEEVEATISLLKDIAEEQEKDYCPYNANDLRKAAQYLETCRPQNTWKPSDEQMKALYDSIPENVMEISEREMLLNELYKDLRKEYYGR